MLTSERQGRPFKFVGNWPCLDFVNTKNWATNEAVYERFRTYADFVWWDHDSGYLDDALTQKLLDVAPLDPDKAADLFQKGVGLRDIIYQVFERIAVEKTPAVVNLATLNSTIKQTLVQSSIGPTARGFEWQWAGPSLALERVFWPIIWSAAELLTSDQLNRVGKCAGDSCGWLFLDTSRSGRRRWCEMQHCGNLAKARRHYRRHKVGRR